MNFLIVLLVLLAVGFLAWTLYYWWELKRAEKRSFSLVFLHILIPKKESDLDQKKEVQAQGGFKEVVSVMEQLLSSLHDLKGGDYLSLEYLAYKGNVHFYMVVPGHLQDIVEKQITSYYPDAIVDLTEEQNIFTEKSYQAGGEFTLAKDFSYPLKTYQKLESDPINALTNSLSKLEEGEGAIVQILLRPVSDKWQDKVKKMAESIYENKKVEGISFFGLIKDLFKILTDSEKEEGKLPDQKRLTPLMEEVAKSVETKSHKVGFDTTIRVLTSAKDKYTAKNILSNTANAFVQFAHPRMNKFVFKEKPTKKLLYNTIMRLFFAVWPLRKQMVLCTEEIASLFHPPHHKYNLSPAIKWQNYKLSPPPENLPDEGLLVGTTFFRGVRKEVRIKREDRFRHCYIIGQTGTGKSSLLQTLIKQDLRSGEGLCVMDPHGDLAKDVMPFIPRERADDVIYFNPADTERPLGLNLLEAETDEERELIALDAMNMMIKLFGPEIFGPRIQDYFRNGVLTLMYDPEGGALTDIVNLFVNEDFNKKKRQHVKNPVIKAWWDHTFDNLADREKKEMIPYFAAKFGQFITNSTMRNIIGQTKSSFDFNDIMQKKKILLVNLSKGLIGDTNAELLGMIIVSKLQIAAMRRQRMAKSERQDFFCYIDEFQNFVTNSIESILSEARKYRLGMVLAHQYIDQLEKKNLGGQVQLKGAIFGNVGNVLSLKIGEIDAEFMAKVFAPVFSEQDISNMDAFKAVMKLSIDLQPSRPFSLTVQKPWEMKGYIPDEEAAKAYEQLSRLKFGRQRDFIDKEIRYRMGAY